MTQDELTLDALGLREGTDKASRGHGYLALYEQFVAPVRHEPIRLLEIGVKAGASVRTWKAFFPRASIVGVDIDEACRALADDRIIIEIADQSKPDQLEAIARRHGPFDLIVEDGSHLWAHQIITLRTLLPFVRGGGHYIVEDLQTNYGGLGGKFGKGAEFSCMDYLKRLADRRVAYRALPAADEADEFLRNFGSEVDFVLFSKHCAILRRSPPEALRSVLSPGDRGLMPRPGFDLLANIGKVGDVVSDTGSVGVPRRGAIRGVELQVSDDHAFAAGLLVRARLMNGGWTDWVPPGRFLGTRGPGEHLTGYALRVKDGAPAGLRLRAVGRFGDLQDPVVVSPGQDCVPPDGVLAPLLAMQIVIDG